MNGYDSSLINNLLVNPWFLQFYHGENAGIWAGIVTSMYQIGGVVSLPFVGPASDTFGRRFGMWIGCLCIIVGTIIQGVAQSSAGVKQFMGGRFLLGFGVNIASAAGPMYVVEVSHPAYRGVVSAHFPFSQFGLARSQNVPVNSSHLTQHAETFEIFSWDFIFGLGIPNYL